MSRLFAGSVVALALTGCVTAGEFKQQVEKTEAEAKRAEMANKGLEAANKSIGEQKATIEAHQKTISDLKATAKANDDQIASLQAKLQADDEQIGSLQKSNKGLTETLDASRNDLKQRVADLTKQNDELNQKIAGLSKQVADANQKISELNQQLADAGQRATDLTQKLNQAQSEKDALQKQKDEEVARVQRNLESVTASLKSDIEKGAVQIKQLQGKLTLNLVDKVLFKPGEADVNEEGRTVLTRIGSVLNNLQDKDIRIEGHTDDRPITGELKARFPSNWELSAARATAVARYLQDHAHVDPKRLIVAGYGEYRPISTNDTAENRALNRRIELVLVPRD